MAEDPATKIEYCSSKMMIRRLIAGAADFPGLECQAIVKIPLPARPGTVLVEA